jgi:Protein of unknown function, DUF488
LSDADISALSSNARDNLDGWSFDAPARGVLRLLPGYRIEAIADVRSFPGSRKYPQYGKDLLAASLAGKAIGYEWLPALGGRRRASPDSPNTAWRNASFRGYAEQQIVGPAVSLTNGERLCLAAGQTPTPSTQQTFLRARRTLSSAVVAHAAHRGRWR